MTSSREMLAASTANISVLNDNRRPIGYLAVPALKQKFERKEVNPSDPIGELTELFCFG